MFSSLENTGVAWVRDKISGSESCLGKWVGLFAKQLLEQLFKFNLSPQQHGRRSSTTGPVLGTERSWLERKESEITNLLSAWALLSVVCTGAQTGIREPFLPCLRPFPRRAILGLFPMDTGSGHAHLCPRAAGTSAVSPGLWHLPPAPATARRCGWGSGRSPGTHRWPGPCSHTEPPSLSPAESSWMQLPGTALTCRGKNKPGNKIIQYFLLYLSRFVHLGTVYGSKIKLIYIKNSNCNKLLELCCSPLLNGFQRNSIKVFPDFFKAHNVV